MPITIGNYTFEGPYTSTGMLEDRSGVYAIHCYLNGKYYLIDVGESSEVKNRIENHDRKDCWNEKCNGELTVSVYYTPNLQQAGRREVEQELRNSYSGLCGER
ncbi:MAG: hypothetical protein JSS63_09325 [Bacteroidetes bacterium]|nr:hypothetical protein [Bacteroidota bacterium]